MNETVFMIAAYTVATTFNLTVLLLCVFSEPMSRKCRVYTVGDAALLFLIAFLPLGNIAWMLNLLGAILLSIDINKKLHPKEKE